MDQKICQSLLVTRPTFRAGCIALLAWLVAGCADSTGPAKVARIATPSETIALQKTAQYSVLRTTVAITNTSGFPMAFSPCGVSLEKLGPPALPPGHSEWQTVWAQICYAIDIAGVPAGPLLPGSEALLPPGETASISVIAPVGQSPYPEFDGQPGQYRFHVALSIVMFGSYQAVPHESSVSNTFALVQPPQ